jgi:hypothetical protein
MSAVPDERFAFSEMLPLVDEMDALPADALPADASLDVLPTI